MIYTHTEEHTHTQRDTRPSPASECEEHEKLEANKQKRQSNRKTAVHA